VRDATADKSAEVHVYAQAQHGFNCWARSAYDAPSARLSHGRALQFLSTALD
jgi:carboxymethylenebutenolidase